MVLIVLEWVTVIFLIFTTAVTVYTAIISSPFMSSSRKVIRGALKLSRLKTGENFYDLGCGNGRSLIIAEKEFGANATGFELSPHHYLISKLKCFFLNKKAKVFWKNFYKINLSEADVIFCFLTPRALLKLSEKMKKELKPGARVVIYSSLLPGWDDKKSSELEIKNFKLFLYIN